MLVAHAWTGAGEAADAGASVAAPDVYEVVEEETQRRIEIIDVRGGRDVVTIIEVLSRTNKGDGAAAYRTQRRLCRAAGVNFVELDLLRGGEHLIPVPAEEIPPHKRTPYSVCVSRGAERGKLWVWHIGLLSRLPTIAIPLRPGDRDATVELQPLLDAAYRDGRYDRLIDYRKPLSPPLPAETRALVEKHLRAGGSERG